MTSSWRLMSAVLSLIAEMAYAIEFSLGYFFTLPIIPEIILSIFLSFNANLIFKIRVLIATIRDRGCCKVMKDEVSNVVGKPSDMDVGNPEHGRMVNTVRTGLELRVL